MEDGIDATFEMRKKRDKLVNQIEDAKQLKKCINKRKIHIVKSIKDNLGDSVAVEFEEFVDVKIKLIGQIKMAEENLRQETICQ